MKVLFDTNVLIECFRNPLQRWEFDSRFDRPMLYVSSVVAMELYAGCRTGRHEKELSSFLKPFERAGRLLAPDHNSLVETGKVLSLLARGVATSADLRRISNDVLIAVTAGRAGVVVVTRNAKDFSRIEKCARFRWTTPD